MAQPLIDRVLHDARTIIADRGRRLRGFEAVGADGNECDPVVMRRAASAPWALLSTQPTGLPVTMTTLTGSAGRSPA